MVIAVRLIGLIIQVRTDKSDNEEEMIIAAPTSFVQIFTLAMQW